MPPSLDSLLTLRPAIPADTDTVRSSTSQASPVALSFQASPKYIPSNGILISAPLACAWVRTCSVQSTSVAMTMNPLGGNFPSYSPIAKRSYDGARSALAGLAYAFDIFALRQSGSGTLRQSGHPGLRRPGWLHEPHSIRLPGGDAGTVFELGCPA